MKTILLSIIFTVVSMATLSSTLSSRVYAVDIFNNQCNNQTADSACVDCNNSAESGSSVCGDVKGGTSTDPVLTIIKGTVNILSYIIGACAIIGVIVGSIRLIVSGGDSNKVASARSGITYALIGVAIAVLAQALLHFVLNAL